jgi:hypothetical protein
MKRHIAKYSGMFALLVVFAFPVTMTAIHTYCDFEVWMADKMTDCIEHFIGNDTGGEE